MFLQYRPDDSEALWSRTMDVPVIEDKNKAGKGGLVNFRHVIKPHRLVHDWKR